MGRPADSGTAQGTMLPRSTHTQTEGDKGILGLDWLSLLFKVGGRKSLHKLWKLKWLYWLFIYVIFSFYFFLTCGLRTKPTCALDSAWSVLMTWLTGEFRDRDVLKGTAQEREVLGRVRRKWQNSLFACCLIWVLWTQRREYGGNNIWDESNPRSMFIQKDEMSSCSAVNAYICGFSFQYNIDRSLNSSTITVTLVVQWSVANLVNFTKFVEDAVKMEGQNCQVSCYVTNLL